MGSQVELVWNEQIRIFEVKDSKNPSTNRQPSQSSPKGMEAIQEVDEECFSTNKTHMKHEGQPGSRPTYPPQTQLAKNEVNISDFSRVQVEREVPMEGSFKVITERTEEQETSRLDGSQTSIQVAKEQFTFSFKKDKVEGEENQAIQPRASPKVEDQAAILHKIVQRPEATLKDSQKTTKRGIKPRPADKVWSLPKFTPSMPSLRDKSMDRRFRSGEKDIASHVSRSRSNCDTERKGDPKTSKDTDTKSSSHSKRFFKSFRDILQKHGHPLSMFSAKTLKTVEAIQNSRVAEPHEIKSYKGTLSPDLAERSLEFPRKSKSFLKIK